VESKYQHCLRISRYAKSRSTRRPAVLFGAVDTACITDSLCASVAASSLFPFPWRWTGHLDAPTFLFIHPFHNRFFEIASPARLFSATGGAGHSEFLL
jgi:hypothetical protein